MAQLDALFRKMVEINASDLHLSTGMPPMFRLHGDIVPVQAVPLSRETLLAALMEITPEANRRQFEAESDTDFAYELEGCGRFRSNLFMDHHGPGGVFRLIPSEILTVKELGLPESVLQFCSLTKGLVVVTGPTGSGKSTTLAAMVDHINKTRSDHVITIEDPIEFVHPSHRCLVNQREVGVHTQGFKRALRAALREDPDIVLVGEMRDLETVEIAMETAETGHLVFGTLHTTTAASTVDRIIDQFPQERQSQIRTMLSTSLKGVVAQTLCKKKPKGRIAAIEVLVVNSAVSSLIRDGKTYQIKNSMQVGGKQGMRLLNDSLAELVEKGLVDPHEAYLKAVDKDDLVQKLSRLGIKIEDAGGASAPAASLSQAPAPAAALPASPAPHAPGVGLDVPDREPAAPAGQAVRPIHNGAPPQPEPPPAMPSPPAQQHGPQIAPAQPGGGFTGDPFEQFRRQRKS